MPSCFVTGGSGFVGRSLIVRLRREGASVRALARSESARKTVEAAGAQAVAGDLDDVAALRAGMEGCDTVFHAAAAVELAGDEAKIHRTNVTGTENALRAAKDAGTRCFVNVGAAAVVADGTPRRGVDETLELPKGPAGIYSRTKALAEKLVREAGAPGFRTVTLRPPIIWGKGDTSALDEVLRAVRARRFAWIGGGKNLLASCHVRNLCEALLLAAKKGEGVYFVTDGETLTARELLTDLLKTQGVMPPDISVPRPLALGAAYVCEFLWKILPLPGNPPIVRTMVYLIGTDLGVSDAKIRRELGYKNVISIAQGMAEMSQ